MKQRFTTFLAALFFSLSMVLPASATVSDTGYSDVDAGAWYAESVTWCRENNLMAGVGGGRFAPDSTLTRAMLAAVLWRQAGSPVVNYLMRFNDVPEGQWYTESIRWAASEELVRGYGNGRFGTNDPITQQQLDIILNNYLGQTITQGIPGFDGSSAVTTRAQVAAVLQRLSDTQPGTSPSEGEETMLYITVNGTTLTATLANNSSAEAFRELLANGPCTIQMSDYGNFEKVGPLGQSLPTNNQQITTEAGDIILYQGNQITIYYDRNSWNFTRLGKINDVKPVQPVPDGRGLLLLGLPLLLKLGQVAVDLGNQVVGRGPDGFKGGFQLGQLLAGTPPGYIAERVIRRVQPVVLADGVGHALGLHLAGTAVGAVGQFLRRGVLVDGVEGGVGDLMKWLRNMALIRNRKTT